MSPKALEVAVLHLAANPDALPSVELLGEAHELLSEYQINAAHNFLNGSNRAAGGKARTLLREIHLGIFRYFLLKRVNE